MGLSTAALLFTALAAGYGAYEASQQKAPKTPEMPEEDKAADEAAIEAQEMQRKRAKAAFGRQDTILTGGLGLSSAAPTVQKTLLGL